MLEGIFNSLTVTSMVLNRTVLCSLSGFSESKLCPPSAKREKCVGVCTVCLHEGRDHRTMLVGGCKLSAKANSKIKQELQETFSLDC